MTCECQSMGAIGDVLPKVVWPGDVADYVARLDPQMRATHAAAASCAELPPATLKAWTDFFGSWGAFKKDATCFFGCANKFDTCAQFERDLVGWQELIGKSCKLVGPPVSAPPDDTAIKWMAAAVIVVAVVYAAGPIVRSFGR
jgi:hypothetical protein